MGLADVVSSLPCVLALTAAVGAAQFAYLDVELQLRTLGVLLGSQLLLTGAFQAFSTTFREKPLLAAFEFVSTGFCAYVSWHGVQLAAANMLPHDFEANSAASRILEEHDEARYYNTLLGGYGLWELGLLLALPDMRSWDNVLHHFFVCVVVVLTMYPGPFGQFYSPYYAGVQVCPRLPPPPHPPLLRRLVCRPADWLLAWQELSSVPLGAVDLFKQFKPLQTDYPSAYFAARFTFALAFVAVRMVVWVLVSQHFWRDLYAIYDPAGSPLEQFQFWVCLSSNLFLTGLQMLWGRLVIRNSLRVLGVLEKPKKEGRRD